MCDKLPHLHINTFPEAPGKPNFCYFQQDFAAV